MLTPASVKPPTVVPLVNGRAEAEAGDLTGVDVSGATTGFSGTGYVTGFDNATDQVSITVNATAGLYDFSIGYASPNGDKGVGRHTSAFLKGHFNISDFDISCIDFAFIAD